MKTRLVDANGQPVRATKKDRTCPQCGAGPEKRQPNAVFGTPTHDECSRCGYVFEELTSA